MAKLGRPRINALEIIDIDLDQRRIDDAMDAHRDATRSEAKQLEEDRDLVNQLLGQAQMADAFAQFSKTVFISKLAFVKENKLYRSIKGRERGDGDQLNGTWDEFCSLLNISREKADLDIANLRSFGEDALESMSRMGIGYRELRQFRKLPEDQKSALVEVAKTGDKDSFLELAEDLIAKHIREKAEDARRIEYLQGDLQAMQDLSAEKSAEIEKLREGIVRIKREKPDVSLNELRTEAINIANECSLAIFSLRNAFVSLHSHHATYGGDSISVMMGCASQIMSDLEGVLGETGINLITRRDTHPWLFDDKDVASDGPASQIP